jgi:hypothetical protein
VEVVGPPACHYQTFLLLLRESLVVAAGAMPPCRMLVTIVTALLSVRTVDAWILSVRSFTPVGDDNQCNFTDRELVFSGQ